MRIRRTDPPAANRQDWRTLRDLLPYLWDYRGRAGAALLLLLLAKGANVGVPVALKGIVDALDTATGRELALPVALLLAYGLLRLGSSAFNELRDLLFARARHGAMRKLSLKLLRHLHDLDLRFHLERRTGAISRDLDRGTRSASSLLNYLLFSILPILVEVLLIVTILLLNYTPWFAILTLLIVTLYGLFTFLVTDWRMQYRRETNRLDSQANALAVDSLLNFETVKYFNNERYEQARYGETLGRWEDAAVKTQTALSGLNVGQGVIIAGGVTGMMSLAAHQVVAGTMTLGDLVMVNAFLLQLFIPLGFLGVVYSQLKHALSDMEQMFSLLRRAPEIRDHPDARPLQVPRGEVRFQDVAFAYQPERPILHNIDFTIPPGRKVAVVGHSGAGKSTLARLLFRFYEVNGGRILIDGQDLRNVTRQSLREAIGIVPQDTVLFNDTIHYNIAYGRPDAPPEAIHRAARLAQIHDFITSLPQGYDTVVGERGLKLSGGEKQRVAIARTILKDPPILIFDEATSSLDSRSEQAILSALRRVAADRSTLIIAHRLSTIVDADHILVLENGRIAEAGDHAALLAADGIYARLWALQQKEAAWEAQIPAG